MSLDVLILAEDFYPKESGGAFIDWNVATHLADQGDSVTVVTPRNDQTAAMEFVDGVEIRRPFRGPAADTHPNSPRGICWRLLFVLFVTPYLFYLSWQREFDLVYSTNHLLHSPAALLSAIFCLPHISFVGYSPSIQDEATLTNPLVMLERLNFRFSMGDYALCRTPSTYEALSNASTAGVDRIDGIVDEDAVTTAVKSTAVPEVPFDSTSGIQLIFVGRLVNIKNPVKIPYFVSQLPSKYSLLIVGDGPQCAAVKEAIHEAGVSERTQLAGRLSHNQTLRSICESDLLVLPSEVEAYPTVVFEALSLNTQVLATPVGVLPEIDHPKLTTAPLEMFSNILQNSDFETERGIDYETLERFSVEQFTREIRCHLVQHTK